MKALQLQAAGRLELVEVPVPEFGPREILVRTDAAVICTSDIADIRENPFGIRLPVVLGHEAAGTVAAVGSAVKGFHCGDRIATHPVHPCYACPACAADFPHLCERMQHFGMNIQGTFAEFYVVRQDRARLIPAGLEAPVAALAEPVAVCLEALERARLREGEKLLILGDGPFGAMIARLAGGCGSQRTVIGGHNDWRLNFAGKAVKVNIRSAPEPVEALLKAGNGAYDAAIIAVSRAEAYQLALKLLRPRGRAVVFSPVPGETPLDLTLVHMKELEITGAVNDLNLFDNALSILSAPGNAMHELITHVFALDNFEAAIATAAGSRGEAMKVAFSFHGGTGMKKDEEKIKCG